MDRFSEEQIREINDAFYIFDVDGSGDIANTELRDMLKTIGFNPTDKYVQLLIVLFSLPLIIVPLIFAPRAYCRTFQNTKFSNSPLFILLPLILRVYNSLPLIFGPFESKIKGK